MTESFLLYGASGYTGDLIARLAAKRGLRFILAGRNAKKIEHLAQELQLPHRVFALEDKAAMDKVLGETGAVIHCAGPFSRTSKLMVDGCLRNQTHYLDITGEVSVFESLAARDSEARSAGIMLLPGIGFDVVPSDCLAAYLKAKLPTATRLALGIQGLGRVSRGTARTMIENLGRGGLIRRDGRLTHVPAAWKTRAIDFGRGPVKATTIPWGDLSTAFRSTGIPNIEVYAAIPDAMRWMMIASRPFTRLLDASFVQRFLKHRIQKQPPGPNDEERARGKSLVWGEVEDAAGQRETALLRGPEGYTFTAMTALAVMEEVIAGHAAVGFQTPSLAFGADFVLRIEGVALLA